MCSIAVVQPLPSFLVEKGATRKVLLSKFLNFKIRLRVVLRARCSRWGIENIALDRVVRLGYDRVGLM